MKFTSFTLATTIALSLCITSCIANPVADADFVEESPPSVSERNLKSKVTIDFDNKRVGAEPKPYVKRRGLFFYNIVAFNGVKYMKKYPAPEGVKLGIEAAASSPSNFGAPEDPDGFDGSFMGVACPDGSFQLKSVMLTPLAGFDNTLDEDFFTPPPMVALITGLDSEFKVIAVQSVTLDITKKDTPIRVDFGKVWKNVNAISFTAQLLSEYNGISEPGVTAFFGIDDLNIVIRNPCSVDTLSTTSGTVFDKFISTSGTGVESSFWRHMNPENKN